jgi:hypothetical protein
MKGKAKVFFGSVKNKAAVAGALMLNTALVMAQETTPSTPESAISDGQTKILALIALAGAAYIAIALASTSWEVGAKLVKRLKGKA